MIFQISRDLEMLDWDTYEESMANVAEAEKKELKLEHVWPPTE